MERKANRASLICFLVLLVGVFTFSLIMVRPFLLAIMMGCVLAVICAPLYRKFRGEVARSKAASALVTLVLLLAVLVPTVTFTALCVNEAVRIANFLNASDQASTQNFVDHINQLPFVRRFVHDTAVIDKEVRNAIQSLGRATTGAMTTIVSGLPQLLLRSILAILTCFFLLIDGPRFFRWAREKIPLEHTIREKLTLAFHETSVSVIWATLAASGAQAAIMLFSFLILGVPGPFLASGAAFLFAWIPMIGSSPIWISGAAYLILQGATLKTVLMVVFGLSAGITDNIVRPLVLKGRAKMHPLVSLISIFDGIHFFGMVGVFLGPIVAAVLILLLDVWDHVCVKYGLIDHNKKTKSMNRESDSKTEHLHPRVSPFYPFRR